MYVETWVDETVDCYNTYPQEALLFAKLDYPEYQISHYVEQHPDAEIDEPLEEIDEESWLKVEPERDLPD